MSAPVKCMSFIPYLFTERYISSRSIMLLITAIVFFSFVLANTKTKPVMSNEEKKEIEGARSTYVTIIVILAVLVVLVNIVSMMGYMNHQKTCSKRMTF